MSFFPAINLNIANQPFPLTPNGQKVSVQTTDDRHYVTPTPKESPDNLAESFADVFKKTVEKVNDLDINSNELTQKMIYDPNSVDAHEVMIAAEKARIAISLTKTIADGVIRAYRELSTLR